MAEAGVKQVLEKEVTCPLCLDQFKEPKKLPCDHVYCKECLRGLALHSSSLNATISCPECRTITQLPGNDVDYFPTAFQTNRLIEAFQQVQIQVETDSPNVTEMCLVHPIQPLAIYCETCMKQLCRDCVLMSKGHAGHEYGFFKEVAPKYRKQLSNEISQNTTRDLSISKALGEIAAAEANVDNHAQKCQDDIEHTFEELISVLQSCKQALKDEATAYYSSLTDVFDQQKDKLKDIQSKIKSVAASVGTLQEDDQSFLVRMESIFERISNLQRKFQAVSLTVSTPQLVSIQAMGANSMKQYIKENCFICELAQADICSVDLTGVNLYVDRRTSLILTLRNSSEIVTQYGKNRVDVDMINIEGSSTKGVIDLESIAQGKVEIKLTPERRGLHQLSLKVNGAHIKNSPFTVTVHMPPKLLSQPVAMISGLKRPASLVYSQTEDKVLAAIVDAGTVVKVDSQFRLVQSEFTVLPRINEITQDPDLNVFFATTRNNQLHKISHNGKKIKSIGQLGKKNAEFDYPSGLRVSKKRELYVCDSRNNRMQIFDSNLNFKRSFGKKGTGKGQFDAPGGVDFDSSGNIYVTEENNYRIQVFTSNERYIRIIIPEAHTFNPVNLFIHNENVYATDCCNHKVWVMNTSGETIATFGDGILRYPEGITIDKAGFVYVTSDGSMIVVF